MNSVDLMYLTNKFNYKKVKNKIIEPEMLEDINFYKKRLMQQTIDLLNGNKVNELIDNSFKRYLSLSIQNLKFRDKVEIIQKDYKDVKVKKAKEDTNFDIIDVNKGIERKNPNVGKLTDKLDIKIKYKNKRTYIMPKKRIINLKDEKFKEKGVGNNNLKKENITNIIDNASSKNKKEKKKKKDKKKEKKNTKKK